MVKDGLVNLDFADVETVMSSMGKAMMGTGEAEGEGRAVKATELALNNPLIDDYSLRGAKGLLINITGGEDLTLFEVDEIVNKIRSEVDTEAEIINGSIIEPSLEGKIRVSIVATALDGQQPESKSVINMVHRIQNRNPGYSDFNNIGNSQTFAFSNPPVTEGATALKLEDEVVNEKETASSNEIEESNLVNSSISKEIEDANNEINNEIQVDLSNNNSIEDNKASNGLENFDLEKETPELFNEDSIDSTDQEFTSFEPSEKSEEDDLEIPAFLRRQKH